MRSGGRALTESTRANEEFVARIREHEGIVRSLARLYARSREEREDLAQEICLQLWRAYPTYTGGAKFSTWMYRVGLNTAISSLRRNRRHPPTEVLADYPAPAPSGDEERLDMLYAALRRLDEARRALILLWLDDLSYEEIGEVLGVSKGTVSVRLVRAKEKLREEIRRLDAHGGPDGRH